MKISEHAIPDTVCHVSRVGTTGKKHLASSKDLLYPLVFFLSYVISAPPWSIKGGAGHPTKGTDRFHTQHTVKQQPSSWHPFDHFRDLGPVPLSTVCTPYYESFFGTNNTSSSKLDVGTNINLLVGVYSKHRQYYQQVNISKPEDGAYQHKFTTVLLQVHGSFFFGKSQSA